MDLLTMGIKSGELWDLNSYFHSKIISDFFDHGYKLF